MRKKVVVVGLGNFGMNAVRALYEAGQEVYAIDVNEHLVDKVSSCSHKAAVGDGTDPEVLRKIGAGDADTAILSTGDDITASILSLLALKDLGVPDIYVKVISEAHERVIKALGGKGTVFPEKEMAMYLAKEVSRKGVVKYLQLAEGFNIQEMKVRASWVGKSLRDLNLRQNWNVSIVAIHNNLTDNVDGLPDPDQPLHEYDTLMIAGNTKDLEKLADLN